MTELSLERFKKLAGVTEQPSESREQINESKARRPNSVEDKMLNRLSGQNPSNSTRYVPRDEEEPDDEYAAMAAKHGVKEEAKKPSAADWKRRESHEINKHGPIQGKKNIEQMKKAGKDPTVYESEELNDLDVLTANFKDQMRQIAESVFDTPAGEPAPDKKGSEQACPDCGKIHAKDEPCTNCESIEESAGMVCAITGDEIQPGEEFATITNKKTGQVFYAKADEAREQVEMGMSTDWEFPGDIAEEVDSDDNVTSPLGSEGSVHAEGLTESAELSRFKMLSGIK